MKRLLLWLKAHPVFNWVIILAYFVFCLFYHERAQAPFFWLVAEKGQIFMNRLMSILLVILVIGLGFYLYKEWQKHPEKNKLGIYWVVTFLLTIVSYKTLMPYNSEGVHFPQYALMAFLIVPRFKYLLSSLCLASIVGYLDELFQYFYRGKIYLDFNDFVLNFLGAAFGVLIAYTVWSERASIKSTYYRQFQNPVFIVYLMIFILALAGMATGILGYFADDDIYINLIAGIRECHYYYFWFDTPWGKAWHQILPVEGMLISIILPLLYLNIDPMES